MKKSVWIFLFAVLLPSVVLGWLALRSAEEQQIILERRTAELYQKETESLAGSVRDMVAAERRIFGETVRRLLAKSDADALARDFTNTLADAWPGKVVGFAIDSEGKLVSPSVAMAAKQPEMQTFLLGNGSFLTSREPAIVYNWGGDNLTRGKSGYSQGKQSGNVFANSNAFSNSGGIAAKDGNQATQSLAFSDREGAGKAVTPAKQAGEKKQDEGDVNRKEFTGAAPGIAPASAAQPSPQTALAATRPEPVAPAMKQATPAESAVAGADSPMAAPAPGHAVAGRTRATETETAKIKTATAGGIGEGGVGMDKPSADSSSGAFADAVRTQSGKNREETQAAPKPQTSSAVSKTMRAQPLAVEIPKGVSLPAPAAAAAPIAETAPAIDALQMKSAASAAAGEQVPALANGMLANATGGGNALNSAQSRQVEPQQVLGVQGQVLSTVVPETAQFSSLTEESDEGMVARFTQDKLNLIFWLRPPEAPEIVFGCLVEAGHFAGAWKEVLERHATSPGSGYGSLESKPEFVLALLDDRARPVATQPADASARDWKHPFVASEIGEVLPHWEAALYLASPTALADSARGLWRTLAFTIAGAVALIALGGWLVVADARRQLALAQQKTDFVSNVSHELKTPLTSIRMFAELMHDRPQPAEKQSQYLRIITVEAERLTRLINNVLDFAKIGRKQKRMERKPLDLHALVARVWEGHEMHLGEAGFTTHWEAASGPYPVLGDDDALAQVLVNLLSNAEKYSNGNKAVELHTWIEEAHVNIAVMDRGMGVPNGDEKKIFEAFYRAHDSLNSGIQGSGLGLTLAKRIAHEHGGEIRFERREGGGCRFTLRIPLARPAES